MENLPSNLKYTKTHEWCKRVDSNTNQWLIGITDHAQKLLGELVYVELPEVDETVKAGVECVVVESVKAAADVYAPFNGRIIEVNESLNSEPQAINESPYDNGWLFKIEIASEDESPINDLLDNEAYQTLLDGGNC